jgi:3-keto-disaccharide hydrolase
MSASVLAAALVVSFVGGEVQPTKKETASYRGRWDLVVEGTQGNYPSWLEVRQSGYSTLVGSFVGRFGSARPISRVDDGGHIHFTVPPQWEGRKNDLEFEGILDGEVIHGQTTDEDGKHVAWTGRRAPSLNRTKAPTWGQPIELCNGKDLTGWKPRSADDKNNWAFKDGVLVNTASGTDLVTEQKFTDFKLRTEYRYPKGSNSGVYLRGRYEVQIEDDYGEEPDSHQSGGVYGFLTPSVNAAKKPGEWQTLDVTLVGRTVTVVLNGERVIDRQAIPGITGGALDSDEGAPGPILLQGDHGAVEFRNLSLTPGE